MERQEKFLESFLSDSALQRIVNVSQRQYKKFPYSDEFGRYFVNNHEWNFLTTYLQSSVGKVRSVFESETLLPTYAFFAHYTGENASLLKHKDNNACTYTIDVCLYAKTSWGLFVDGREHILDPGNALAFYGEDQEHWREEFPDPEVNEVGMLMLHYVEPDHWFYTKEKE